MEAAGTHRPAVGPQPSPSPGALRVASVRSASGARGRRARKAEAPRGGGEESRSWAGGSAGAGVWGRTNPHRGGKRLPGRTTARGLGLAKSESDLSLEHRSCPPGVLRCSLSLCHFFLHVEGNPRVTGARNTAVNPFKVFSATPNLFWPFLFM